MDYVHGWPYICNILDYVHGWPYICNILDYVHGWPYICNILDYVHGWPYICNILDHSLITWRLYYANDTPFGLLSYQLNRLQKIWNNTARLVTLSSRICHISDITCSLHWLPIKQRIDFKILMITMKSLNDSSPSYIHKLLKQYNPTRTIWSSNGLGLTDRKTINRPTGDRCFANSAPKLWNNLPFEQSK